MRAGISSSYEGSCVHTSIMEFSTGRYKEPLYNHRFAVTIQTLCAFSIRPLFQTRKLFAQNLYTNHNTAPSAQI